MRPKLGINKKVPILNVIDLTQSKIGIIDMVKDELQLSNKLNLSDGPSGI